MAANADSTPAPAIQPAPVTLTHKAEAYVARQLRPKGCPPGIDPVDWRRAIAKRIEQHRDAEQALIEALHAVEIDPEQNCRPCHKVFLLSIKTMPRQKKLPRERQW